MILLMYNDIDDDDDFINDFIRFIAIFSIRFNSISVQIMIQTVVMMKLKIMMMTMTN